ncbi:D-aminoacylase, partial [candidate division KSB1 bacterium]|nr:D-aminoacylase [candidate division KSB1 bacterium]
MRKLSILSSILVLLVACATPADYDVIIRNGVIYDGTGNAPYIGNIGITGDKIAAIGNLETATGGVEIDAEGMAVSPGFINMLSWATTSLIEDGNSQSDIRQGVTLEVFGEGGSSGPLNDEMKKENIKQQGDIKYDINWTTLGEYLEFLENRGISTNVASFVGATTVRIHEIGYEDRPPTTDELENMKNLVRRGMEEGALGVGSSLIYAPAFYAKTDELIELAKAAAEYDGMYISHIRSEANRLLEAVDELITIAGEADIRAEIYHFKAAGRDNWGKLDQAIAKVQEAREDGLQITADMYTYTAGSTGLDAAMPPWVQEGGLDSWIERLSNPETKLRVMREMKTPTDEWENLYLMAGAENTLLV